MGRKVNLSSLADAAVEDIPGRSTPTLTRLRLEQVATTPLNPRANFGSKDELTDLGESMRVRQLQPVVTVSRTVYLKLWPEHTEHIGSADYILVNGERRYRSAQHVGLHSLDALIRDEVADSREAFLDALLSENIDRKNFDPIEEAHAVEAMVQECGSAVAAAARFRRHETWVSQRRALLKLTPAIQQRVRDGEIPVRIARTIATRPQAEQETAWHQARDRQTAEQERRTKRQRSPAPRDETNADTDHDTSAVFTAVKTAETSEPSRQQTGGPPPGPPWHSPHDLASLIREHVSPENITVLMELLQQPR